MKIQLEPSEALLALGAIQDKQLTSSRLAAISTGEEHEIADMSAKVLARVATRIVDALYPTCVWVYEDEMCGKEFAGHHAGKPFCRHHLDIRTMHDIGVPA